jgi:hypothetical protein
MADSMTLPDCTPLANFARTRSSSLISIRPLDFSLNRRMSMSSRLPLLMLRHFKPCRRAAVIATSSRFHSSNGVGPCCGV